MNHSKVKGLQLDIFCTILTEELTLQGQLLPCDEEFNSYIARIEEDEKCKRDFRQYNESDPMDLFSTY